MTNKMSAVWEASKRRCHGVTSENFRRNKKKSYKTHADRVKGTAAARGKHTRQCHERVTDCKSVRKQAAHMKGPERFSQMKREVVCVKRRAAVLPSCWKNTIICYQLGSGALNTGTYGIHQESKHTQAACWFISLPKAGSAQSLYCSGVQYGASPRERQQKANELRVEKMDQGKKRSPNKEKTKI